MSATRNYQEQREDYSTTTAITIGVIVGICMGWIDMIISILLEPTRLATFANILAPLAATTVFCFLLFTIPWFAFFILLGRLSRNRSFLLATSFALFLGTFLTLNFMIGFSIDPNNILRLFILFVISTLVALGAYFTSMNIKETRRGRRVALVLCNTFPFFLAETMLLAWLHIYKVGSFRSGRSLFVTVCYFAAVIATISLMRKIGKMRLLKGALSTFMIIVIIAPFIAPLASRFVPNPSAHFVNKPHKIRHVLLITVDTLRRDVLSCYNPGSVNTAHIDSLAADGILFSNPTSAAPWTLPGVSSIITGVSPSIHGVTKLESTLPSNLTTIAEYMHDAGYYTSAIVRNGMLARERKISQGFDTYEVYAKPPLGISFGEAILRRTAPSILPREQTTVDITYKAMNWLQKNRDKDFFLWVHYLDPHLPYSPPLRYIPDMKPAPAVGTSFDHTSSARVPLSLISSAENRAWIKVLYESEVRYIDEYVGKLIDYLKRLGLYDESLIIFSSDHGEEFWEHDGFEHGHSLYNELLEVPLIIKLPHETAKGRINMYVSTESILPTMLDVCGIQYDSEYLSSVGLTPLWGPHPETFDDRPIVSTGLLFKVDMESVVFDGLKYIHSLVSDRDELYDLRTDPGEINSIAAFNKDEVDKARKILELHKDKDERAREDLDISDETMKLNKKTIEKLKGLGYL